MAAQRYSQFGEGVGLVEVFPSKALCVQVNLQQFQRYFHPGNHLQRNQSRQSSFLTQSNAPKDKNSMSDARNEQQ